MSRASGASARGARLAFPFQKESSWYRPSERERLRDQNEKRHLLDFSSSSQTDCKRLRRHVAGKFHWLLGLALPSRPHQLSRQVPKLPMPHLFQMGQPGSRAQTLVLGSSIHVHLLAELIQPLALKTSSRVTTPNLLFPSQNVLSDCRFEQPPPLKHLHWDGRLTDA